MKLFIKNKIMSLNESSFAENEQGEQVFTIKGKVFTITHKKEIYDKFGNLLFIVKNKIWNFWNKRAYILNSSKEKVAVVKFQPLNFKTPYILEGYKEEIALTGNFAKRDLQVTSPNGVLGTITRDLTLIRDAFTLEAEEKDLAFLTAVVIAIDNIVDAERKKR